MKRKVRSWEAMESEFGLDSDKDIAGTRGCFTVRMREYCGTEIDMDATPGTWTFCEWMLEPLEPELHNGDFVLIWDNEGETKREGRYIGPNTNPDKKYPHVCRDNDGRFATWRHCIHKPKKKTSDMTYEQVRKLIVAGAWIKTATDTTYMRGWFNDKALMICSNPISYVIQKKWTYSTDEGETWKEMKVEE